MRFEIEQDEITRAVTFSGQLDEDEFLSLRLDALDRATLKACGADRASAADFLLGLEVLFRRLGERSGLDASASNGQPMATHKKKARRSGP